MKWILRPETEKTKEVVGYAYVESILHVGLNMLAYNTHGHRVFFLFENSQNYLLQDRTDDERALKQIESTQNKVG